MGKSEGEHNTIVGICDEIAQAMYQRGWLREVPGAGKTYIPTAKGRNEMLMVLNRHTKSTGGEAA